MSFDLQYSERLEYHSVVAPYSTLKKSRLSWMERFNRSMKILSSDKRLMDVGPSGRERWIGIPKTLSNSHTYLMGILSKGHILEWVREVGY